MNNKQEAYIKYLELFKEYYDLNEDYNNTYDMEELIKLSDLMTEIEFKIEDERWKWE